jgi:hypothetical protein
MIPEQPFPPHSLIILRTSPVAKNFILQIAGQLGLHFTIIFHRLIVEK